MVLFLTRAFLLVPDCPRINLMEVLWDRLLINKILQSGSDVTYLYTLIFFCVGTALVCILFCIDTPVYDVYNEEVRF